MRWGGDFARVGAVVEAHGRTEELEVVIFASSHGGGARKRIRVNGVNRRASALAPVLRTVLFAPEDMLLIIGSPSLRRNLLDDLVAQREVTAAAVLSTYARALTQRNSLLQRIREEAAEPRRAGLLGRRPLRERRSHPRLAPRGARRAGGAAGRRPQGDRTGRARR